MTSFMPNRTRVGILAQFKQALGSHPGNHAVAGPRLVAIFVAVATLSTCSGFVQAMQDDTTLRSDLEKEILPVEAAFRSAPDEAAGRRAYADFLFRLGNMREANQVAALLATVTSGNRHDLELGAKIALLLSDYDRAEALYKRLMDVAAKGSESYEKAVSGLVRTYYQSNQYGKTKDLKLPIQWSETRGIGALLIFMQKFEGEPYQIEWATEEKVAHLNITNDFRTPGALPLMTLQVNGHDVEFILDTGGDRLYIDNAIARKVGIRNIHKRQSKYAYTGGETVEEPLGIADSVTIDKVTLKNVPVIVAQWKGRGLPGDGVVTTQILKQFLSTVDYEQAEITLRERSDKSRKQVLKTFGSRCWCGVPFFMASTHLMFAKGSINGRTGLNMFMDSGLASSMPLIIHDESAADLGLQKRAMPATKYFTAEVDSYGIGPFTRGRANALGNVMVEKDPYRSFGFIFDALISHQYLYHLGSWTIDFDSMTYYFPCHSAEAEPSRAARPEKGGGVQSQDLERTAESLRKYEGSYHSDAIRSDLVVAISQGRFSFTASGSLQGTFGLAMIGEHRFEAKDAPEKVVLEFTVEGDRATSVTVTVSGQGPFLFIRR